MGWDSTGSKRGRSLPELSSHRGQHELAGPHLVETEGDNQIGDGRLR